MKAGAIWIRKDKNGNNYYSIALEIKGEKYNFKVFKNTRKTEANQPDFSILDGQQNQQPKPQSAAPITPPSQAVQSPVPQQDQIDLTSIPF